MLKFKVINFGVSINAFTQQVQENTPTVLIQERVLIHIRFTMS